MVTNEQLYLAVGIPLVFNVNAKFQAVNTRFDDMRDLWRSELRRVEGVLDARLNHLEQRR